jgi:hypothetical protein
MNVLISTIMSVVPPEKLKPFKYLSKREICNTDKAFVLKIIILNLKD